MRVVSDFTRAPALALPLPQHPALVPLVPPPQHERERLAVKVQQPQLRRAVPRLPLRLPALAPRELQAVRPRRRQHHAHLEPTVHHAVLVLHPPADLVRHALQVLDARGVPRRRRHFLCTSGNTHKAKLYFLVHTSIILYI
jgi:hypothetical protein